MQNVMTKKYFLIPLLLITATSLLFPYPNIKYFIINTAAVLCLLMSLRYCRRIIAMPMAFAILATIMCKNYPRCLHFSSK